MVCDQLCICSSVIPPNGSFMICMWACVVMKVFCVCTAAMRETKEALESVTTSLEILQEGTGRLQSSLQSERASLSNTLNDPACSNGDVTHTCNNIRGTLSQLALSANFNGGNTHTSFLLTNSSKDE